VAQSQRRGQRLRLLLRKDRRVLSQVNRAFLKSEQRLSDQEELEERMRARAQR